MMMRMLGPTVAFLGVVVAGCAPPRLGEVRWSVVDPDPTAPPEAKPAPRGVLAVDDRVVFSDIEATAVEGFEVAYDEEARKLVLSGRFPGEGEGPSAQLALRHHFDDPHHLWMPHLTPADGFVIGDHAFRSPAMILADEEVAVALIPDLEDVGAGHAAGWSSWMDYNHPERQIVFGAGNYRTEGHVFFVAEPVAYAGQEVRLRVHVVASRDTEDLNNPYGMVARWIWERWGRPRHEEGGSQLAPVERYAEYVNRWAFSEEGWGETVWQEFEIDGRPCGAPAFIVDVAQHPSVPMGERRWREQRSIWNQAWFSTQRCANGLLRYARQIGSEDLERRARLSTNLALSAPQTDGLFPAVYTTARRGERQWYQLYADTRGWGEARWTNSDRRPPDASEDAYHILDAAFTARLLLEWSDLVGGDEEAIAYVTRFADRLVELQLPSGAFPGWVEPDGTVVATLAEGPETAMGATLLLELLERDPGHQAYEEAALGAIGYLWIGPVLEGRWEDFETYFSCNNWGRDDLIGKRFWRNGVFKQNTLSIFWAAEAFLAASRTFGKVTQTDERRSFNDILLEAIFLSMGRRCLDELSLYQQVWDPPFIAAPCHGGWGVMNTDGEWNDARQSLFAPLYLEYYRATGEPEYFERGVAALRASFAMMYCPENEQVRRQYELRHPMFGPESYGFMMENIAHGGPAPADGSAIGPFTIYTWGNGAALATAAKVRDLYGDVYIDAKRGRAFGIDGCEAEVRGNRVRVHERFGRDRLVAVNDCGTRREVRLADGRGEIALRPAR